MEQQIAGVPQQKKRRKYKDLDEQLVAFVKGYSDTNKNKYFKSIAHDLIL